jgi:autotransporter-associated beta strand protein
MASFKGEAIMSTKSTGTSTNKLYKVRRRARLLALSACLAWALPAIDVRADTYVWRGGNGRWVDSNHWNPKGFPQNDADVADMRPWAQYVDLDGQIVVNAITFAVPSGSAHGWVNKEIRNGAARSSLTLAGMRPTIAVIGDPNRETTISATLSGTQPWTKTGPAILALGGNNDFTAAVTVVEGQMAIQNPASLTGAPPITVRDGAQLGIYASGSYGDSITLNGGVGQLGALFLNKDAATYKLAGPITLGSATQIGAYGSGDVVDVDGVISGAGDLTLVGGSQNGEREHSFNLDAAETFSGKLSLADRGQTTTHFALKGGNNTLPKNCDVDLFAQNSGNKRRLVELDINGTQEDLGIITASGNGSAVIDDKSDQANGVITAKSIRVSDDELFVLNVSAVTLGSKVGLSLFNGGEVVFRGGELNVKGQIELAPHGNTPGSLLINGGNLNADGEILMGEGNGGMGMLIIRNGTANAHSIHLGNGGPGAVNLSGGKLRAERLYTGSNGVVNFNNGILEVAGANVASPFVGPNVSLNVMNGGATIDTRGFDTVIAGEIHGPNGSRGSLTKLGDGTLTLSAQNSFTGATNVNGGALVLPLGSSLTSNVGVNLAGGMLAINGGTVSTEVLDATTTGAVNFDGGTLQVADGNVASPFVRPAIKLNVMVGGATINTNGFDASLAGPLLQGTSASTGGLTKSGGGTLTVHGGCTYTGPTRVTAGTLALAADASIAQTSLIDLAVGARLDVSAINGGCILASSQNVRGSGTIAGDLTLHGTIQPRQPNGVATLTFNNHLTLSGSTISVRLDNQGGSDQLNINGAATVEKTNVIDVTLFGNALQPGSYDIINAPNGGLTGKFLFANDQGRETLRVGSTNYLLTLSNSDTKEQLTVAISQ